MIARIKKYPYWKRFIIIPVIGLGVLAFMALNKTKQPPTQVERAEKVTRVRVIEARSMPVIPRAVGYGYIKPRQEWEAVAQVPGSVVEVHPDFERGAVIPKGEVLLRIDPADSSFVRQQSEAEVRRIQAELSKLAQSEKDTRRKLEVEEGRLKLVLKELDRNRSLVDQGVMSQSELDTQDKAYLAQRNVVQNYESSLNSIPSERASLQAQLAAARSKTAGARLDEERTVIRTPFDSRISETNVELGQAVSTNQVLATLDSLGRNEAFVQVPLYAFRNLLPREQYKVLGSGTSMEEIRELLGIGAVIRMREPDSTLVWTGSLSRIADSVDASTRTIGVYLSVDELQAGGDDRALLIKNMYAEVELFGRPSKPHIVIPRIAMRHGSVYVVGEDNRLVRKKVEVLFSQSALSVIKEGLEEGDRVVVSDLVPAVDGMLLDGQVDEALQHRMEDLASAKVAVK